jgi:hypothetical protein
MEYISVTLRSEYLGSPGAGYEWFGTVGKEKVRGFDAVLNAYARTGWELVSIAPEHWSGSEVQYEVNAYRVVFKR